MTRVPLQLKGSFCFVCLSFSRVVTQFPKLVSIERISFGSQSSVIASTEFRNKLAYAYAFMCVSSSDRLNRKMISLVASSVDSIMMCYYLLLLPTQVKKIHTQLLLSYNYYNAHTDTPGPVVLRINQKVVV